MNPGRFMLITEDCNRGPDAPLMEYEWNADKGRATIEVFFRKRYYLYTSPQRLRALGSKWEAQWRDVSIEPPRTTLN